MAKLGFIGLGTMGKPMATHLVGAGHQVTVYDIDETAIEMAVEDGAVSADSLEMVAEGAEAVFLSLPDPETVEAVIDEIQAAIEPNTALFDLTTSTPGTTYRVSEKLAERGVSVLGAPVSGGPGGATEGNLTVMVSGDAESYEQHKSLLETFSSDQFYISEDPGHGHAIKLLNNYLSFTGLVAASEAVALGEQIGLDLELMLEVFSSSSGRNSATEEKLHHVIDDDFDFGFPLGLMEKDIRLLEKFGNEHQAPMMLASVVSNLIGYANADYGENTDMTRLYSFCKRMMNEDDPKFLIEQ